jgi:hypothetical protein
LHRLNEVIGMVHAAPIQGGGKGWSAFAAGVLGGFSC